MPRASFLEATDDGLEEFADRPLETLSEADRPLTIELFTEFRLLLGQVGAAKALGLLLPRFFPLLGHRDRHCLSRLDLE